MDFLIAQLKLVGSWTTPPEKYAQVKLDHFPGIGEKNEITI